MKKIFIITGELSGDRLGAWYIKYLNQQNSDIEIHAVGGNFLQEAGAKIYERFENLNVVGLVEILKKLPFIFKFLKQLSYYIIQNHVDQVVLVDFPGFNLRLAKKLKSLNPKINITYVSPPQTWVWGAWRIKKLKKYCDKLVVLYPFEVEWYKKHGLKVDFIGNPVCEDLKKYFIFSVTKVNQIAIIPGSRESEIKTLFPFFAGIIKLFKEKYPDLKIILPLAQSISLELIEAKIKDFGLSNFRKDIKIIFGEKEKYEELSKSCLAITKPGTVSLELALLQVPAVVFYKTSWITYFLARPLVKVKYMALPNLLLDQPVYEEIIQWNCNSKSIFNSADTLYQNFLAHNGAYFEQIKKLSALQSFLGGIY